MNIHTRTYIIYIIINYRQVDIFNYINRCIDGQIDRVTIVSKHTFFLLITGHKKQDQKRRIRAVNKY